MNELVNYLLKVPRRKFIFIVLSSIFIWTLLATTIGHLLGIVHTQSASFLASSNLHKFEFAVLLAPFFETLVFQFLFIEFLYFLFKNNTLSILISGIIFGSIHYFNNHNIVYAIAAIVAGLIFSSIYVLAKKRKDIYPFLMVWLSHMFINAVGFIPLIIRHFFK